MKTLERLDAVSCSNVILAARYCAARGTTGTNGDALPIGTNDAALNWIAEHVASFRTLVQRAATNPGGEVLSPRFRTSERPGVRVSIDPSVVIWSQLLRALWSVGLAARLDEERGRIEVEFAAPVGEDAESWRIDAVASFRTARVDAEPIPG